MNKDFLKGWDAARVAWQATGAVPPYPPQEEFVRTKQASGMSREEAEKALQVETARRQKRLQDAVPHLKDNEPIKVGG